jgi:hypothetical protein
MGGVRDSGAANGGSFRARSTRVSSIFLSRVVSLLGDAMLPTALALSVVDRASGVLVNTAIQRSLPSGYLARVSSISYVGSFGIPR